MLEEEISSHFLLDLERLLYMEIDLGQLLVQPMLIWPSSSVKTGVCSKSYYSPKSQTSRNDTGEVCNWKT